MVEVLKMSLNLTGPFKNLFYLAKCNSSGIQSQNFAAVLLLENWLSWFNFEITPNQWWTLVRAYHSSIKNTCNSCIAFYTGCGVINGKLKDILELCYVLENLPEIQSSCNSRHTVLLSLIFIGECIKWNDMALGWCVLLQAARQVDCIAGEVLLLVEEDAVQN